MSESAARVLRHTGLVRVVHWSVAVSGIVLLFSGFGELPMYKRYNVVELPGLSWAGDFELNLVIHYVASVVFLAAILFHVVHHVARRQLAAVPRRGDLRESVAILRAMLKGGKEPPHGKFLAEQRVAYGAFALVIAVLAVTGMIKTYKNLGDVVIPPAALQVITLLHTAFAVSFLLLLVLHLAAFLLRANWPLLPSMVTGTVSRAYARRRHPLWRTGEDGPDVPSSTGKTASRARNAGPTPGSADRPRRPWLGLTTTDIVRLVPGVLVLISVGLAVTVSSWWLVLAAFVGVNLLQSAWSRWCLLERLLIRLGVPSSRANESWRTES